MGTAKIVNLEEFRHARESGRRGDGVGAPAMNRQRELWKYIEGNFKFPEDEFFHDDEDRGSD